MFLEICRCIKREDYIIAFIDFKWDDLSITSLLLDCWLLFPILTDVILSARVVGNSLRDYDELSADSGKLS